MLIYARFESFGAGHFHFFLSPFPKFHFLKSQSKPQLSVDHRKSTDFHRWEHDEFKDLFIL